MVKNYFLAMVAVFIYTQSLAQVTITVADKATQQPITGALVFYTIGTDADGWIAPTAFNIGQYNNYLTKYTSTNVQGVATISKPIGANDKVFIAVPGYLPYETEYGDITKAGGKVYLSINAYTLGDVVISASKFEEKRDDIAQNVQVISSKAIAFQSQQTTADVLQQTGNVLVQKSQQGGGSPSIRGFEASRVLIVIDGVRLNNAIFRAGHLQNALRIDNSMLDKAEIVFGPGSVVYGSDALGGVMHFYTRNPILSSSNKALVTGGAYTRYSTANNEITGHADVSVGLKKWGFLTGFTYSKFGDLMQGGQGYTALTNGWKRNVYVDRINGVDTVITNADPNLQVGTGYTQYDIQEKVIYRPSDNFQHTVNFQFSNTGNVPRYDRLTELNGNGVPKSSEWYYGPEQRMLVSYKLDIFKANKAFNKGRIILAYQDIKESRHNRNFGAPNRTDRFEKVKVYSLNLDYEKQVAPGHELRYGLEGTYNDVNSTARRVNVNTGAESAQSSRYPAGGSQYYTGAAYVTHAWEINKRLILNDGIRLSYVGLRSSFNDTTFFPFPYTDVSQNNVALNGNIGLVYMPGAGFRVAVVLSTGFRAPNVDDLAKVFDSAPGTVILPNPDIKPEYTYNADFTISKTFAKRITVEANGYYTVINRLLNVAPSTFNGQDSIVYDGQLSAVTQLQNRDNGYISGGYFAVRGNITDYLAVSGAINYTYGRIKGDTLDIPLDHVAPTFGRAGVMLTLKKFQAEAFSLFSGKKKLVDYSPSGEDNLQYATAEGMPGWFTLNLRAAYQFNRYVQLQVALENILDKNYRTFASGTSAAGRNLMITLRSNF